MRKCNLCYDRTSQGKGPMCATVCPTQAIFYGTYEEWLAAGRGKQGAKPVNVFYFGRQRVQTRNYVVMTEEDEALDLMAMVEAASLGKREAMPEATAAYNAAQWVDAEAAGIPQRAAPPQPWTPRTLPQPEPAHSPASALPGTER
jgi:Fe-S-cluster-containing hydrogenase component 2